MANEPPTYLPPSQYVENVGTQEKPKYIAGPRSKKFQEGESVSNEYAKSVLGSVLFRNKVKGWQSQLAQKDRESLSNDEKEVLDNYNDAQKAMSEFVQIGKEITKKRNQKKEAIEQDNQEKVEEIEQELIDLEQEIDNKRQTYGSP